MPNNPAAGELRRGRLVGAPIRRTEDPRLLTGEARYLADLRLPGMLHARFVRSPLAHALIASITIDEAIKLPGVCRVLTGADVASIEPLVDGIPFENLLEDSAADHGRRSRPLPGRGSRARDRR